MGLIQLDKIKAIINKYKFDILFNLIIRLLVYNLLSVLITIVSEILSCMALHLLSIAMVITSINAHKIDNTIGKNNIIQPKIFNS